VVPQEEGRRRKEEGGRRKDEGGRRKEEGGRKKEEGGRRKEEGGRRKEEGGRKNAEGGRRKGGGEEDKYTSAVLSGIHVASSIAIKESNRWISICKFSSVALEVRVRCNFF
jgi:ATP-dependent RNA helicase DHX57